VKKLTDHEKTRARGEQEGREGVASDDAAGKWLEAAEAGKSSPLLANGAWKGQRQTSAQARLLRALGISPLGLSRGEASAAISAAKAKQERAR